MSFDDSEVEKYIELFFDIDIDRSGIVSRREMREYFAVEGMSDREIERLIKHFDLNKSGQITLDEWCTALGVSSSDIDVKDPSLPEHVSLISADLHVRNQVKIVRMTEDIMSSAKEMKDVAKDLKASLDKRFNKLWHVVIVKGQYWAYYSHEPKYSFVFKLNNHIVLVWRTPMP